MKTLKNILVYIVLGLMGFTSLPFIFVEFRNFFSFEFVNLNNPFLSGLGYLLRGIFFLLIFVQALFAILFMANKKKFCIILFATGVSLFFGALLSLLFYVYYISLIIIFITLVELVIIAIGFFKKEKAEVSACPING